MFEESISSIPSLWASVISWLTPTVLFVLLNLMIGTIAITSNLGTQHRGQQRREETHEHRGQQAQQQARSPSVLQRLKSINLYTNRYERTPETETHYTFKQLTPETEQQPQIVRSPSVLQRIKSFSLYNYISQEHGQLPQTDQIHYDFQQPQVEEEEEEEEEEGRSVENKEGGEEAGEDKQAEEEDQQETLEEVFRRLNGVRVMRSTSDTKPAAGEMPVKLPKKMRKSASTKSAFSHFEEEVEVDDAFVESLRPATVREGKVHHVMDSDDEVDAKADDFINKFKHQLKLQRLNSIVKYKEMIGRGASGK